jgi:hypothetical protein
MHHSNPKKCSHLSLSPADATPAIVINKAAKQNFRTTWKSSALKGGAEKY